MKKINNNSDLAALSQNFMNDNLEQCCQVVRQIAIRWQLKQDFIFIEEPQNIEDVYRYRINNINGVDYIIFDDTKMFIMRLQKNANGAEDLFFCDPQEIDNIANAIRQKYFNIIERPEFIELEPEIYNKEIILREDAIYNLQTRLCNLNVGACAEPANEEMEYEISLGAINGFIYTVCREQIFKSDLDNKNMLIITTSNQDRFLLQEAIDQINKSCEIIENQSESLLQCYKKIQILIESGLAPDFIYKQEASEDEEEINFGTIVVEINNNFYTIGLDFEGRATVYFVNENGGVNFLSPERIADFVDMVNYKLESFNGSVLQNLG